MQFPNWLITTYSTGIPSLDRVIGGLRPCELIVLAGIDRRNTNALALQCTAALASQRVATGIFARGANAREARARTFVDGTPSVIVPRVIEMLTPSLDDLGQALSTAVSQLAIRLAVCHDVYSLTESYSHPTPSSFQDDGIWLDIDDEDDRIERPLRRVSRVSRTLKSWAMKYRMPIVAQGELSNRVAGRIIHEPRLGDLGEDDTWECDADVVLFVHGLADEMHVIVAKNRNGPVGRIPLEYDLQRDIFREWK